MNSHIEMKLKCAMSSVQSNFEFPCVLYTYSKVVVLILYILL